MGCIKNFIKAIILAFAIVGFLSVGGKEWLANVVDKYLHMSNDSIIQKAQKLGDFSEINEEYELEKATGMFGYNGIMAEHKATGQKMVIIDANKKPLLTKEDITSENIEPKIKSTLGKIKYQALGLEDFSITKHGELYSYGSSVPYVRFKARITRFPVGEVGGVVAAAKTKDGEDRILISVNESSKYSQLLAEEFFKKVK